MQIHQRRAETARTSLNAHVRGAMASLSPGSPAGSGRKMARPEAIHLRIHKIDPGILGLRKHEESNKKQRVAFQDTCSGVPMGGKGCTLKKSRNGLQTARPARHSRDPIVLFVDSKSFLRERTLGIDSTIRPKWPSVKRRTLGGPFSSTDVGWFLDGKCMNIHSCLGSWPPPPAIASGQGWSWGVENPPITGVGGLGRDRSPVRAQ